MKTACFDLECTDLKPYFGTIICCGILPIGGTPYIVSKGRSRTRDGKLVKAIKRELEKYDCLISFYGLNFDVPMLNARLLKAGLEPLEERFHIDLYRVAKKVMKCNRYQSVSLSKVCKHLKIKGEQGEEKGHVDEDIWLDAIAGNKKALEYIFAHCKADVAVLPPIFDRLKSKIRSISKA